jgi:Domain of unknown function (DUF5069)
MEIPGSTGMGDLKGKSPDDIPGQLRRPGAKNLRTEFPRSSKELLGGYVHLARMIDKARAREAGVNGDYVYPCPLDKLFLSFLEIAEQDFTYAAKSRTDELILEWLVVNGRSRSTKQIELWNKQMLERGPDDEAKWAYFNKTRDAIDPSRTDVVTWIDLLDLEEGRQVPPRAVKTETGSLKSAKTDSSTP